MNRTRPKFMENVIVHPSYYEEPNPYENAFSCNVNLLELSRYAKRKGKRISKVTKDEIKQFLATSLVKELRHAEERAKKEGWIDADDLERELIF